MKRPHITADQWITRLFYGLYIAVAIATFRHTSAGFASIEGGSKFWGGVSALALDAGMILSASGLRQSRNRWLIAGLIVSAVASTYTQLLYSMFTAGAVDVAPGAAWLKSTARTIINWRVVVLPALLPVLSIVYAFSAKSAAPAVDSMEQVAARIRGETDNKGERVRRIRASENGREPTVSELAELANCSISTVNKARGKE